MNPTDRLLRNILTFQGIFYMAMNLWALVATPHFLSYTNAGGNVFEVRSFAALSIVLAIYFIVGAWRADLLRPAAFLGLGSAVAITLVQLFHLPQLGLTLLWLDMIVEIGLAATFITLFFFWEGGKAEEKPAVDEVVETGPEVQPEVLPAGDEITPAPIEQDPIEQSKMDASGGM